MYESVSEPTCLVSPDVKIYIFGMFGFPHFLYATLVTESVIDEGA